MAGGRDAQIDYRRTAGRCRAYSSIRGRTGHARAGRDLGGWRCTHGVLAAGHSLIPLVFSVLPDPVGSGVAPRTTDHHGPPTSRSRKLSRSVAALWRLSFWCKPRHRTRNQRQDTHAAVGGIATWIGINIFRIQCGRIVEVWSQENADSLSPRTWASCHRRTLEAFELKDVVMPGWQV
jgi:hypothetical protein